MKVSEMIKTLQQVKEAFGDCEVVFESSYKRYTPASVSKFVTVRKVGEGERMFFAQTPVGRTAAVIC